MRKTVTFFIVLISVFTVFGEPDETQIFAAQLYNQAVMLLESSKAQCKELPQKNKALATALSNLAKTAKEHKNVARSTTKACTKGARRPKRGPRWTGKSK